MRQLFIAIITSIILFSISFSVNAGGGEPETRFLVLTDIHFDPFTSCYLANQKPCPMIRRLEAAPASQWAAILAAEDKTNAAYRQDTSYTLLTASLKASQQAATAQHVKFVLVLGDMIGHAYREYYRKYAQDKSVAGYRSFTKKTFQFLNSEFAHTFPSVDVYSLVGNNDSYRGNYSAIPHDAFFIDMAGLWSSLVHSPNNRATMQREFPAAGYYAIDLPGQKNMRLIALNTVLFSNKDDRKVTAKAAWQELTWLHQQLQLAKERNQRVLIALHIPEGVDVYASLRVRLLRLVELWQGPYTERFQQELHEFAPTIAGIFAGHLHADWFQVLRFDNMTEIPVLGTPSISPIYGNNPGFKIYSYSDSTRQLNDFVTYYYPIDNPGSWREEYDFSRLYKPNCLDCPVTTGMNAIKPAGTLANAYKLFYSVRTTSQPITTKWDPYYWCAIREVSVANYQKCIA